jgi:hypothetical protein
LVDPPQLRPAGPDGPADPVGPPVDGAPPSAGSAELPAADGPPGGQPDISPHGLPDGPPDAGLLPESMGYGGESVARRLSVKPKLEGKRTPKSVD